MPSFNSFNTPDSPSLDLNAFASRIQESPIAIQSLTGPGGPDLSLSELSLDDLPPVPSGPGTNGKYGHGSGKGKGFKDLAAPTVNIDASSLVSKTQAAPSNRHTKEGEETSWSQDNEQEGYHLSNSCIRQEGDAQLEDQEDEAHEPTTPSKSTRTREERLQSDLLILRTLNSAIVGYIDALKNAKELSERVGARMQESNNILDRYVDILWESEKTSQLIFDKKWQGGEIDDAITEERARQEQEAQERILREERERRERENEAKEREAADRAGKEAERAQSATGSSSGVKGVRGVRGSRATARGRGSSSVPSSRGTGVSTSGVGRGISARGSNPSKLTRG